MIRAINLKKFKPLALSLLISVGTGLLSSFLTGNPAPVYEMLLKPAFAPPQWVFPVVWSILYVLIGIAAYLVCRAGKEQPGVRDALFYYGVTLLLTFFWPIIFFRWNLYGFAVVWIILLLIAALITTYKFWRINGWAGAIMALFSLWVAYATVLTTAIWQLNRVTG